MTADNAVLVFTSSIEEDDIDDANSRVADDDISTVDEGIVDEMIVVAVVAKPADGPGTDARLDFAEPDDDADMEETEEDADDADDADETDGKDHGTVLDGERDRRLVRSVVGATATDEGTATDEMIEFDIGVAEFTEVVGVAGAPGNAWVNVMIAGARLSLSSARSLMYCSVMSMTDSNHSTSLLLRRFDIFNTM